MATYVLTRDDELAHYGIKNQKWGNRRYQYEDGTRTPEGKERYSKSKNNKGDNSFKDVSKLAKDSGKAVTELSKNIPGKSTKVIKPDLSKMSDDELRKKVNRLTLEEQYGRLSGETKYKKTGSEYVRETLQTVGAVLGIAGSAIGIAVGVQKLMNGKNHKGGK